MPRARQCRCTFKLSAKDYDEQYRRAQQARVSVPELIRLALKRATRRSR
jgi:hypothetical protein